MAAETIKLVFVFSNPNLDPENNIYTRIIDTKSAVNSDYVNSIITAFDKVPEEGVQINIMSLVPQDLRAKIVLAITETLDFLGSDESQGFRDEMNEPFAPHRYEHEQINKIIGAEIPTLKYLLPVVYFLGITPLYNYICYIIGTFIKSQLPDDFLTA